MTILISVLIGLFVGTAFGFFICSAFQRMQKHSGVMKIIRRNEKIIYSLELEDDPRDLEYKSEVIFKVETSDESSDRK